MNMLSKPVERCRKTSYSLNLSLALSALNALYKLLEIFCCILSLKKHLQAIGTSLIALIMLGAGVPWQVVLKWLLIFTGFNTVYFILQCIANPSYRA
jgi:hypothetical protein